MLETLKPFKKYLIVTYRCDIFYEACGRLTKKQQGLGMLNDYKGKTKINNLTEYVNI